MFIIISIINQNKISQKDIYVSNIVVDDGYSIINFALKEKEFIYAIYQIQNEKDDGYFEILVIEKNKIVTSIRQYYNPDCSINPNVSNLIIEKDVNFDGKKDILINKGNFGVQLLSKYNLYIQITNDFKIMEEFGEVENPGINYANKKILSSNRQSANTYNYYMYKFEKFELIMSDMLEISFENDMYKYSIFEFENNEKQLIDEYITSTPSQKIYNEGTYWALDSIMWKIEV